ncbi:MAG: excinuclease ABC subunit UvrA [Planctomycetota bacterium]|nr:excinuclease ABC subunit UvrA [Planctomycetota bacterium]
MSSRQGRPLIVRGARENNLKSIDVEIPRDRFVVVTGISGSGKSTLAHGIICREGQRRFVESLSAYARQYLGRLDRPKVETVEGLSPTISIDQKTISRNPRSTVGTITEILDLLRLLYSRLGVPYCPKCGEAVEGRSRDQIVSHAWDHHSGEEVLVCAPIVLERKGEYRKEIEDLRSQGFARVRIDGQLLRLADEITLARYERHTIEVVLDKVKLEEGKRGRFAESVEKALGISDGLVNIVCGDSSRIFSSRFGCLACSLSFPEMEPRLFSFNSPQGACQRCDGLGRRRSPDVKILVKDPQLSIADGALNLRRQGRVIRGISVRWSQLEKVARLERISLDRPWRKLSDRARKLLVEGSEAVGASSEWPGFIQLMEEAYDLEGGRELERMMPWSECGSCEGSRLHSLPRAVRYRDLGIDQVCSMTVIEARAFFANLRLAPDEERIGQSLFPEIVSRLEFMERVGLGYLALNRSADTLSGGEAQRIRLASQLGSGLRGVLYVLDEPTIGLHPADNQSLLEMLRGLRDLGNSLLVVEHDRSTIASADHVIDIGPGAGTKGGELVADGSVTAIRKETRSITGQFLAGKQQIEIPSQRRDRSGSVVIHGARMHNLKDIDVDIPLASLVAVTGASGSGKSTLVQGILLPALANHLGLVTDPPGDHDRIDGLDQIDKMIRIDQSPIGRTPRSNPGTYTKALDDIRDLFARTPEARARGWKKGRFSFNVKGGRCEACEGAGVITISMQFMADISVVCEECNGSRFNDETRTVRWRGHDISEVLALSIEQAAQLFADIPQVHRTLDTLLQVGLDYVSLGQPSTTLSGGEAQRVKLATELRKRGTGNTLYVLDEPTTGLHFADIQRLLGCLHALVDRGNTVLVIEHCMDVVLQADHVIDLGPGGGQDGGKVVASGTPEQIARSGTATGDALAVELGLKKSSFSSRGKKRGSGSGEQADRFLIEGARQNNLKDVRVEIPAGKFTVITGPSGSGKSTLAFDILFAEGQRRYIESLSTYARRFLGQMDRAEVDRVEGIAPAIAIDQRNRGSNPRSTVATSTEIYDYLRILFSRAGIARCTSCGEDLESFTPAAASKRILDDREGQPTILLAPLDKPFGCSTDLIREGYARVRVDGKVVRIEELEEDALESAEQVEVVVDRIRPVSSGRARISESVEEAYRRGGDRLIVASADGSEAQRFTRRPSCPDGHMMLAEELSPRLFSFNHHSGACSTCSGLGVLKQVDARLLITDPSQPLFGGAMDHRLGSWIGRRSGRVRKVIDAALTEHGFDPSEPIKKLGEEGWRIILEGTGEISYPVSYRTRRGSGRLRRVTGSTWEGLLKRVSIWHQRANSPRWRKAIEDHLTISSCPRCGGGRLKPELLEVRIAGENISEVCGRTVEDALKFFDDLKLTGYRKEVADQVHREVSSRLRFLQQVGLDYLELDRSTETLSGGEAQRIRLATQIGNQLVGVLYVLDEPTIGLHARDVDRLLDSLEGLRDQGNTLVVVEHDGRTIRRSDHVVDLGPGAGILGGEVVAEGDAKSIEKNADSPTGRFLSGRESVCRLADRRPGDGGKLRIVGAQANNLTNIDVEIPTGAFTTVTGVSGSGKSTLVMDILACELATKLAGARPASAKHQSIEGYQAFDGLGVINQQPLGRTPASNAATYTGVMAPIRSLFARTELARMRGWGPGRFSFNVAGGRCESCEGKGGHLIEMHFLSDVWIQCQECRGRRYEKETLKVRWKGNNIADVLEMDVQNALVLFEDIPAIATMLKALVGVGLGYLSLGQPATTLSGGEAQRVKLASELGRRSRGTRIYILDEPTTGLHFCDVSLLLQMLHRLVDRGDTVVVVEHDLNLIASSDHVIDMGPEGGQGGGQIVVEGTPEQVAACRKSHTGKVLKETLRQLRDRKRQSRSGT